MTTLTPQELEDLQRGIMQVPFDIIAEEPYLWTDFVGCKALSQDELPKWLGPILDIGNWHRAAQIDFTKSTVIGLAFGPRPFMLSKLTVVSMTYNGPANELVVEVNEKVGGHYHAGVNLKPFQIVKCLNVGNAKITYVNKAKL